MTVFLSMRTSTVGGSVKSPDPCVGSVASAPGLAMFDLAKFRAYSKGKNVLFAVHGFNVSQETGIRSLSRLEAELRLDAGSELFIGVLWPGDFWLPAINYPWEGDTAIDCGQRLAKFCNENMQSVGSLSFASHSLGARLVLEATKRLNKNLKPRSVTLTAGAINRDCLTGEYAAALRNVAGGAATLASHWDLVLKLAYPMGDPIANLMNEDHAYGTAALGREGPPPPAPSAVSPSQIPDEPAHYGHQHYFPPSDAAAPPPSSPNAQQPDWRKVANYIARTFRNPRERWR